MKSKKRLMKRILLSVTILIVTVLLTGFLVLRHIAVRAIPDYNETIPLHHLRSPVTVFRDSFGVPSVYAGNEEDLYRAVGYLQAQDRLWQMDLLRRAASGTLAEIFGADLAETDLLLRSLRIPEKSTRLFKTILPEIRRALAAYTDGVNQYIDNNRDALPPEFFILNYRPAPWRPEHSLHLIGYMAWDLTSAWSFELFLEHLGNKLPPEKYALLFPGLAPRQPVVFPGFSLPADSSGTSFSLLTGAEKLEEMGLHVFMASNNWVISPRKSVTGKAILANDMHLGLSAPGIWLPMQQHAGNTLHVSGLTLPGQPFIIAGHNNRIAWGMTNLMTDDLDFYVETIHPQNPDLYQLDGTWKKMAVRREAIAVRGGQEIKEVLRFTHRGPVISRFQDETQRVISMRWIGSEDSREVEAVYKLNRAKNWTQFREAVTGFVSLGQNIVYADIEGNIGLQTAGGIPIRENAEMLLFPGNTSRYDWKGLAPFKELPFVLNPDCGYAASANQNTTPEGYPYYISRWFDLPERAGRITDLLEKKALLSLEDMCNIQGDTGSRLPQWLLPDAFSALETVREWSAREQTVLDILKQWNGDLKKGSAGALIFEQYFMDLCRTLIQDELTPEDTRRLLGRRALLRHLLLNMFQTGRFDWCDNVTTQSNVEGKQEWYIESFRSTVKTLYNETGTDPQKWNWGNRHTLTFQHPLGRVHIVDRFFHFNRGGYPLGGSFHTPCVFSYSFNRPYSVVHGPSHRNIYTPGDWDESLSIIPLGVSGIPASPHYGDQAPLYAANQYRRDRYSVNTVKQEAKYKMRFVPPQSLPMNDE